MSRIAGSRTLHGSDLIHQGFVQVEIFESELLRSLSHDRAHHSVLPLVSIDMSESQWGSFVSSFGVGAQVSVGDERKPNPPHEDRSARYPAEGETVIQKAVEDFHAPLVEVRPAFEG